MSAVRNTVLDGAEPPTAPERAPVDSPGDGGNLLREVEQFAATNGDHARTVRRKRPAEKSAGRVIRRQDIDELAGHEWLLVLSRDSATIESGH